MLGALPSFVAAVERTQALVGTNINDPQPCAEPRHWISFQSGKSQAETATFGVEDVCEFRFKTGKKVAMVRHVEIASQNKWPLLLAQDFNQIVGQAKSLIP